MRRRLRGSKGVSLDPKTILVCLVYCFIFICMLELFRISIANYSAKDLIFLIAIAL